MNHIVNLLIDRGAITFNPFTLSLDTQRFMFPLTNIKSTPLDESNLALYISEIIIKCETENICESLQIDSSLKDNLFVNVYAVDSFVESSFEIYFDTMTEAVEFAKEKDFELCFDNNTQDYLPI